MDEKLLARNLNMELAIKVTDLKVSDFSISPGHSPHHFLCYVQGILVNI